MNLIRSDLTSDGSSAESEEDLSNETFIQRHIRAEKKEKERYYQSAISQSRKRKKLASGTSQTDVLTFSSENLRNDIFILLLATPKFSFKHFFRHLFTPQTIPTIF